MATLRSATPGVSSLENACMIYKVRHWTRLTYAQPIAHAEFNLRLSPVEWPGQAIRAEDLQISPRPALRSESRGPYPTRVTALAFDELLQTLEVTSSFEIEVAHRRPDPEGPAASMVRGEAMLSGDMTDLSPVPYLFPSRIAEAHAGIGAWAMQRFPSDGGIVAAATALNAAVHREFVYKSGATTSNTPPAEAFAARAGVCQDFAHVMIVGLRAMGIPAAYVSGYLRTVPPEGAEKLVGADAMHAWVAVWCGAGLGWVGFDPTNDCLALEDHIVVAMGRDYADVSPIDGIYVGSAPQGMEVMVDVSQA